MWSVEPESAYQSSAVGLFKSYKSVLVTNAMPIVALSKAFFHKGLGLVYTVAAYMTFLSAVISDHIAFIRLLPVTLMKFSLHIIWLCLRR